VTDSSIALMIMNSIGVLVVCIALPFFWPVYKRVALEMRKTRQLEDDKRQLEHQCPIILVNGNAIEPT
jgi:hypothetical protein